MYVVYCPFPNLGEAKKAAKSLVEEKLCCCINILKSYSSVYKWDGKLVEESEFVMIAKTGDTSVADLEKRIKELHSDKIPEILRIKLDGTNGEYEKWCKSQL